MFFNLTCSMCVAHFPKEILHCLILWQAVICNFILIQITCVWLKNWFFYQKNIKATFLLKKKKRTHKNRMVVDCTFHWNIYVYKWRNRSMLFFVFEFWLLILLKNNCEECDLLATKEKIWQKVICVWLSKRHSFGWVVLPLNWKQSCC